MASLVTGYEYDIFISYRQKDNKYDGWVTEFVDNLRKELEATFKEEISVYFDINPSDYLLESYDVDASLKDKLKCLVFIPIISRTYCDPKAFSWENEFKAFVEQASQDQFGLKVKLPNGNVASRVLPIQIHEIASEDKVHIEEALGGILRPIEFIYKEPGVNRPLRSNEDHPDNNLNKTFYRNQINKVANAIDEIIFSLKDFQNTPLKENIKKQESLEEVGKEQKRGERIRPAKLARLKFLFGFAILSIAVLALVLAYPKIIQNRSSLNAMTSPITVINENGEKEVHRIFKDSYVIRLAIFPFINETSDSSETWYQYGLPEAICQDLSQFSYVTIRVKTDVSHLQEQIKDARANNYPYFLTGAFRVANGIYEITSRLYQTKNGTVTSERKFRGDDFFSIIDSISLQTRLDLGISNNIIYSSPDLPFIEHSTGNLDAFRYYIRGSYIDSLSTNLYKSIEIDSTYAIALYYRAFDNYSYQISRESALRDINQAIRHRKRLIESYNIWTRVMYYSILGEYDKAIKLSEMQHELHPGNFLILEDLIFAYEPIS